MADLRFLICAPKVKKTLKDAAAPLVLVVSEEIFYAIVQQGYLTGGLYRPLIRVRVGNRTRRGRVHVPAPLIIDRPAAIRRRRASRPTTSPALTPLNGDGSREPGSGARARVSEPGGPRAGRE